VDIDTIVWDVILGTQSWARSDIRVTGVGKIGSSSLSSNLSSSDGFVILHILVVKPHVSFAYSICVDGAVVVWWECIQSAQDEDGKSSWRNRMGSSCLKYRFEDNNLALANALMVRRLVEHIPCSGGTQRPKRTVNHATR
jgi:hypothetical protein